MEAENGCLKIEYMGQTMLIFKTCCGYLQQKIHKKITQLGSNWNNGSNAGSFYWNLNNSVRNRNRNISSQLVNALNSPKTRTSKSGCPCFHIV
jgi:hypothetical protein